jgi:hypothetical protein
MLDNFFDRTQLVRPTGSIELQTHGPEVRLRNVYVRELFESEGKVLLAGMGGEGSRFHCEVEDGVW